MLKHYFVTERNKSERAFARLHGVSPDDQTAVNRRCDAVLAVINLARDKEDHQTAQPGNVYGSNGRVITCCSGIDTVDLRPKSWRLVNAP